MTDEEIEALADQWEEKGREAALLGVTLPVDGTGMAWGDFMRLLCLLRTRGEERFWQSIRAEIMGTRETT